LDSQKHLHLRFGVLMQFTLSPLCRLSGPSGFVILKMRSSQLAGIDLITKFPDIANLIYTVAV
jgi:hypothetical protein